MVVVRHVGVFLTKVLERNADDVLLGVSSENHSAGAVDYVVKLDAVRCVSVCGHDQSLTTTFSPSTRMEVADLSARSVACRFLSLNSVRALDRNDSPRASELYRPVSI